MSEIVNSSLRTAAKGTGLVLAGSVIALLLGFVNKLLIIRNTTQAEFGIFSLALAVVSIVSIIATLGLKEGSTRYISVLRGSGEEEKARAVITDSIHIGIFGSLVALVIIYLASNLISTNIFDSPGLTEPLKIISLVFPFFVLSQIIISIFRGYNIIRPKIYLQNILRLIVFLILILVYIVLDLSFVAIFYAYLFSFVSMFIGFIYFGIKFKIQIFYTKLATNKMELLSFSLPLVSVGLMGMIFNWTDTLILGYFTESQEVGLYNGGLALAKLLSFPLGALVFVFMPIAGSLYSKNLLGELKRTYQIITKWVFSAIWPIFIIFFLFPEIILSFLFGESYAGAAWVLRLLALGFLFHTFLGANDITLTVLGLSKFLMWVGIFGTILNIVLNYTLIPIYGITGAAFSTMLSYMAFNSIVSIKLYRHSKIHPITPKYLKPVVSSLAIALLIYIISINFPIKFWMLPILFVVFIAGYLFALLATKSIDEEDIHMLKTIEKKSGIDMRIVKRIAKKFL